MFHLGCVFFFSRLHLTCNYGVNMTIYNSSKLYLTYTWWDKRKHIVKLNSQVVRFKSSIFISYFTECFVLFQQKSCPNYHTFFFWWKWIWRSHSLLLHKNCFPITGEIISPWRRSCSSNELLPAPWSRDLCLWSTSL